MDSCLQGWDTAKVQVWAVEWLSKYELCARAGIHGKTCVCKKGPPTGVLHYLTSQK